jgi:hypothetical protein
MLLYLPDVRCSSGDERKTERIKECVYVCGCECEFLDRNKPLSVTDRSIGHR